jgi:predicted O-methyltransferase YrrM
MSNREWIHRLLSTRAGSRVLQEIDAVGDRSYSQAEHLAALYALLQPDRPLPSMRGWAISPDLCLEFAMAVLEPHVGTAVELGSGSSTVVGGLAFRKRGQGRLVSYEHDPQWARRTQEEVDRHGVGSFVEIRLAPLSDHGPAAMAAPGGRHPKRQVWYDIADWPDQIDVALVDGPPHTVCSHARYPAMAELRPHLRPGSVVFLDDVGRPQERAIVHRWTEDDPSLDAELLRLRKGAARVTVR